MIPFPRPPILPRLRPGLALGALLGGLLAALGAPVEPPPARPVRDGDALRLGLVTVHPGTRTVSLPARVNQTNGVIEYALVTDYGKTHESLLITEAAPRDVQAALLLLNARPSGAESLATHSPPPAAASWLGLQVSWPREGRNLRSPLHELIALARPPELTITGHLAPGPWLFNGSRISAEGFAAHFEGSLVSVIRDPVAILNSPRVDQDDDDIHVPVASRLPSPGTTVTVEIVVPRAATNVPDPGPGVSSNTTPGSPSAPRTPAPPPSPSR